MGQFATLLLLCMCMSTAIKYITLVVTCLLFYLGFEYLSAESATESGGTLCGTLSEKVMQLYTIM